MTQIKYDKKGNVLYIWYKDPANIENIIAEQTENEILIQKDKDTNEVIGYTILHFTKRDNIDEGIDLPSPPQPA